MKNVVLVAMLIFAPIISVSAATAVDMATDEILSVINGKQLNTDNRQWGAVRLNFNKNGKLYGRNGPNSDSGKWRVEDGKLCMKWYRWDYEGCGEMQRIGNKIRHLWPNGDVHFDAKP